jgi:hypothetical protein
MLMVISCGLVGTYDEIKEEIILKTNTNQIM